MPYRQFTPKRPIYRIRKNTIRSSCWLPELVCRANSTFATPDSPLTTNVSRPILPHQSSRRTLHTKNLNTSNMSTYANAHSDEFSYFCDRNDSDNSHALLIERASGIHPKHPREALSSPNDFFRVQEYYSALETHLLGHELIFAEKTDSTQDLVTRIVPRGATGVVCVAEEQTKGRGRGHNTWDSRIGGLFFTVVTSVPHTHAEQIPLAQHLIALAVVRGLRNTHGFEGSPIADQINIKWPNDIYAYGSEKLAGILCQTEYSAGRYLIRSGIGINIRNMDPYESLQSMMENTYSIKHNNPKSADDTVTAPLVSPGRVLASILNELEPMWDRFSHHGFDSFRDEYHDTWLHSGQVVSTGEAIGKQVREGAISDVAGVHGGGGSSQFEQARVSKKDLTIVELSKAGGLLARDTDGTLYELQTDGNTFDMMQGLIRRKVGIMPGTHIK